VTVIDAVVSPVLQVFPLDSLDVSVTLPPGQKVVGPLAEMVGVTGVVTLTVTALDVTEHPEEEFVTV
jgi:hypothetical protein